MSLNKIEQKKLQSKIYIFMTIAMIKDKVYVRRGTNLKNTGRCTINLI